MADDNMVVRMLREIRAVQSEDSARLTRMERQMSEMREDATLALGLAAHSNQASEGHGERFDEISDELRALKRRVSDLEGRA